MTIFIGSNNASTTLAGAITAGATTCALAPGTGAQFPNPAAGQQFALTFVDAATGLNNEIVYVTARSGDTITTMVRAQEGTTAKAWLAGDLANNFYTQGQDAAKAQIPGVQNNNYTYAADTGAANAYAVALSPAPTLTQGAIIEFTAAHANTGASTLAVNGGTAYPIWGSAHSAIQGGEIVANGYVAVEYNPTLNGGNPAYILLANTGGALQIAPATQSQHAMQAGQIVTQAMAAFTTAGTAPAFTLTPSPALTALAANQRFRVNFNANGTTGSNTLNISGKGAVNLMQFDASGTLVPAAIKSGLLSDVEYNGSAYVVLNPLAVPSSIVGGTRNLGASLNAPATSVLMVADEITVEKALGGQGYTLANVSLTLNVTTTGPNGMDTGSAPLSGFIGIYAIYNPTTNTQALLGTNASGGVGSVYSGANMPAGYTASALIAIWPTNGSGQLIAAHLFDRDFRFTPIQVISSTTQNASLILFSVAANIPPNAKKLKGYIAGQNSVATNSMTISVASSTGGFDEIQYVAYGLGGGLFEVQLITAQNIAIQNSSASGTLTFYMNLTGYSI